MSKRVQLTLSNPTTLALFNELKYKQPVKMTNDEFLNLLLSLIVEDSKALLSDTLTDSKMIQPLIVEDSNPIHSHTISDSNFVTKEEFKEQLDPINIVGERMYKMIQNLQDRVDRLEHN